jgi:hypothetical protein
MALEDYAALKAAVISFTGRDDLSSKFPILIALAEFEIYNNEDKPLRVSSLETSTTLQTVGGVNEVALPAGYLNLRSIKRSSGGTECELTYNSPSALQVAGSGIPTHYTIEGNNLVFSYIPDGVYDLELSYYSKPDPLDETNNTNVILTNYPNIYMYACMFSIYDFSTEPELSEMYYAKMLRAIRGAMKSDGKGLRPNSVMRTRGLTP